jgi:hypothetical protein
MTKPKAKVVVKPKAKPKSKAKKAVVKVVVPVIDNSRLSKAEYLAQKDKLDIG